MQFWRSRCRPDQGSDRAEDSGRPAPLGDLRCCIACKEYWFILILISSVCFHARECLSELEVELLKIKNSDTLSSNMNVWISFSLVFGPKADERRENSNMLNGDMILFTVLYYCRALFLSQGIMCMSIVRTLAETLNSKCFYLDVCCFVLYVTLSVQSYVLACSV